VIINCFICKNYGNSVLGFPFPVTRGKWILVKGKWIYKL